MAVRMNPAQKVPLSVPKIFLPPVAGAAGPASALSSTTRMTSASRIKAPNFGPAALGSLMGRCEAAPMKKSIGIDSIVLVREARPARAPRAAASGIAWPPVATRSAESITICWAGQMTNHTLAHMVVPSMPPKKIFQP
jgi:hypothetical protein